MVRSTVKKVMWVGRATVFLVGLAVILAVVLGVATVAAAHSGVDTKLFHLGHGNTATAITKLTANIASPALQLVNTSTSVGATALRLQTASSKPPMTVNSSAKVANLNSDQLDGQDSSAFLGANQKASDSDKLDGIDSTGFIEGKGNIYHGRRSAPLNSSDVILDVPGFGSVQGACSDDARSTLLWNNSSGQGQEAWWFNKDGVGYLPLSHTQAAQLTPQNTQDYVVVLQVGSQGRTATITATQHATPTGCNFSAQAVAQID